MAENYSVTISRSTYKSLKFLLLLNKVSFVSQHEVVKSHRSVHLVWDRKRQVLGLLVDTILKYTSKKNSDTCLLTLILVITAIIFIADICVWCSLLPITK
nr:unnamed protein product [Callosobruchus chinensis]